MILGFFFWSRNARGRVSKALITVKWRNYFAPMDSVVAPLTLRASEVFPVGKMFVWKSNVSYNFIHFWNSLPSSLLSRSVKE